MRISLHRRYLRVHKTEGRKAARALARREALGYSGAACERALWAVARAVRWFGMFG